VNGKPVTRNEDLLCAVEEAAADAPIALTLMRECDPERREDSRGEPETAANRRQRSAEAWRGNSRQLLGCCWLLVAADSCCWLLLLAAARRLRSPLLLMWLCACVTQLSACLRLGVTLDLT